MNGGASLWIVANRSTRLAVVDLQVQVELVDGLEVGHFQEERPAVVEDVAERIARGSWPGDAGVARGELGRAVGRAVAVVPGLGEVALGLLGHRRGRRAGRTSTSTPFSWAWKRDGQLDGSPV